MSKITLSVNHLSIDPGPPRIITFQFKKPYLQPVYLAVLTLTENSALATIDGDIVQGNGPYDGGTCDLQMPTASFSPLWDFVNHHTKLSVTLTYSDDGTLAVTGVSVTSTLAIINTALLEAAVADVIAQTLVNGRAPGLPADAE